MKTWIFVIDTDKYAGNFERDMCAHITGVVGDCEVGADYAFLYSQETGEEDSRFLDMLDQRTDEHGVCRPCSIWETAGWLYDGSEGAVKESDFNQEIADSNYRLHTAKYFQEQMKRVKLMDPANEAQVKAGWTKEAIAREIVRLQASIDKCTSIETKCPRIRPNNSVAIFFLTKPSQRIIDMMKARASTFAETVRKNGKEWEKEFTLNILGFRLIEEGTKTVEKPC